MKLQIPLNIYALAPWLNAERLQTQWNTLRQEIMAYKWIQSEKLGRDIGWDRAVTEWLLDHSHNFDRTHAA